MKSHFKWLYPGMHIKRWLVLLTFGVTFLSLGIAYVMTHYYRTQPFPEEVYYVTLQFVSRPIRGILFVLTGVVVIGIAVYQLSRSLVAPFLTNNRGLVDVLYQHRQLNRGPRVVTIGGGHGLSTLLRGLKEHTANLTAIVTVADDGGSSGRLRQEMGVLPPGDIRMCLVALADAEPLMTDLFQYRFPKGNSLEGHAFGNLFLAAMNAITGNFEQALRESSRVLAIRGQIFPSTLEDIQIGAEYEDGHIVIGESQVPEARKRIRRLFLRPSHPPAYPEAIKAILEADMIVIGPGSLYTSLLPNLMVSDLAQAVQTSKAAKVYVCNVATQRGETEHFTVADHVAVIEQHVGSGAFDYVLVNNNTNVSGNIGIDSAPVVLSRSDEVSTYQIIEADVVDVGHPHFHDPLKLAAALMRLFPGAGSRTEAAREVALVGPQ
ncbi:MAG: YvcK family protein [Chloroflexota bacterium]|nr:MAG: YvcK family protein [Chloroflexota bacterium]